MPTQALVQHLLGLHAHPLRAALLAAVMAPADDPYADERHDRKVWKALFPSLGSEDLPLFDPCSLSDLLHARQRLVSWDRVEKELGVPFIRLADPEDPTNYGYYSLEQLPLTSGVIEGIFEDNDASRIIRGFSAEVYDQDYLILDPGQPGQSPRHIRYLVLAPAFCVDQDIPSREPGKCA